MTKTPIIDEMRKAQTRSELRGGVKPDYIKRRDLENKIKLEKKKIKNRKKNKASRKARSKRRG